jgi:hypothetical protein
MTTRVLLTPALLLVSALSSAQPSTNAGLRIVVVEGEDAINIVQQQTAVAPVIEVRDRNNLPVPGAVVTFSIQGGQAASFGGASTLTVATNAAGQAAVTGLTPTAAGAVQIQVSAAFQGQIATATIAQTNVMTAAQAAAASAATGTSGTSASSAGGGAAGGGAAGGGGGGLSATTIGVVAAAVGGGALAAVSIADTGADPETFTGPLTGQAVMTGVARGTTFTCTEVWTVNASVTLEIGGGAGDRADGRFEITGRRTLVSHSGCGGGPSPTERPVDFDGTVTGTAAAMSGTRTFPVAGTGDTGPFQGSGSVSFEGTRNGDTVTATITIETRVTNTSPGGAIFDNVDLGTFPVTLTKTRE